MNRRSIVGYALLLSLCSFFFVSSERAHACYWDLDTLDAERSRFPEVHELITGKFVRHSKTFYAWRVKDRTERLERSPNDLNVMNDLAVALDKTGRHDEAIALMRQALELAPKRYETHANLGTFLIHSGKFEQGLSFIKSAIRINPEAHFGREIVQQILVEYVLEQRTKGIKIPPLYRGAKYKDDCAPPYTRIIRSLKRWSEIKQVEPGMPFLCPRKEHGFARFAKARGLSEDQALAGLMGMMKFSNHKHPILLEALGDVLIGDRFKRARGLRFKDAKLLAARAYLSASYGAKDPRGQKYYRAKAILALTGHRKMNLKKLERALTRERARAKRWFKKIKKDEERWIRSSSDPDGAFKKKYLKPTR